MGAEDIPLASDRLLASVCQDSFYYFIKEMWDTIISDEPVYNWHIKVIADELQIVAERIFKGLPKLYDLIINVAPGSTKSTVCSEMFPAWALTRMPSIRFICGSNTDALALDLSRLTRMIISSDKYKRLFPHVVLADDQKTKRMFLTDQNGGRISTTVGGSIIGKHGHAVVLDDMVDPASAASNAELKAASDWLFETIPQRKVNQSIAPTILVMQRIAQHDPTGEMLERAEPGEIRHICLPATISDLVSPPELRKYYEAQGGLFDPVRLPEDVLRVKERTIGNFAYAGQYDQCPVPREGGNFKVSQIMIENAAPAHFVSRIRYWDKAGTRSAGCYTAGVLMGKDRHGFFWILDVKRGQWDAFEREQIIRQTAQVDGETVKIWIEQEPGSGGKESAQNTIRNLAGYKIYAERPVGDKALRAEPFSVQVNGGNVKMLKAGWNHEFLNELEYFPNSKYKDQVDAAGGAFAQLNNVKKKRGTLF